MQLAFSQACENNKQPILQVLQTAFRDAHKVLEVGGGTGQHAVYFASALPHLVWQSSDQTAYLPDLAARLAQLNLANLPPPVPFDVNRDIPPGSDYDAIFSANTLHIMAPSAVENFFKLLPRLCTDRACLAIYGPFKYRGTFTSNSNAAFDRSLKQRDPDMGIRDIEWITDLAAAQGFEIADDVSMPANNQLLLFNRRL
jgi:cyclopropane fatty-acyl-phospholipid synthase-like methyltransferase